MPRNLIVFSDGTGNSGGKTRGTNVWRLYNMVDLHRTDVEQRAFYDDGVGTESFRPLKILGGAFGVGLSRNLRQLYTFLVKNYVEGDRIYLFGFSRGAFTVRALAGMIVKCGLWNRDQYFADPHPQRVVKKILRAYRRVERGDPETIGRRLKRKMRNVRIEFVGVWDTVDAVGVPVDEMRWLIDRALVWIPKYGIRLYGFHDRHLSGKVRYGSQALALDDERRTFHPNVWRERTGVEQVWFAGAHSNVGGGYPKDGMAHVTLDWMMGELERVLPEQDRIRWIPGARERVRERANEFDRLYNSRSGVKAFYRYSPRRPAWLHDGVESFYGRLWLRLRGKLSEGTSEIEVHRSVWRRIERASQDYAPMFLPETRVVWTEDEGGRWATRVEPPKEGWASEARAGQLRRRVLLRQLVYFVWAPVSVFALAAGYLLEPRRSIEAGWLKVLLPDLLERPVANLLSHPRPGFTLVAMVLVAAGVSLLIRRRIRSGSFGRWLECIAEQRGGNGRKVDRSGPGDPAGAPSPSADG